MIVTRYTSKKSANNQATCYFCGTTLKEYIENLPADFMEYDIQRGIVTNVYLDRIVETVLNKDHIPPITIVTESIDNDVEENNRMIIQEFKILDGLQRTFRLKILWDTVLYLEHLLMDYPTLAEFSKLELSRKFGRELKEISSSTLVLERLISSEKDMHEIKDCFNEIQWIEIWEGLSPHQEIEKMLLLNAGHKQVSLKHQLELLFLNLVSYFDDIKKEYPEFTLLREKEISSISFSKGRKKWEFHFSHLITACLAFLEKDTITANASLIKGIQDEKLKNGEFVGIISYELLVELINFLMKFDTYLEKKYTLDEGIQWVSRDTVTIGLFAALGKYSEDIKVNNPQDVFNQFLVSLTSSNDSDVLNIKDYNRERANINLSKVNVGEYTKNAVYLGVYNYLENKQPIIWSECFRSVEHANN
ncbi:hypothetical protein [Paenibacillus sp. MER 99-2]|uniref:hypothetical protein n=1 Tax=Paenibacillus sp. MER 99-2 TaxID=2939572 RepID=UPI00203FF8D5|nr:hypothetical protein [Paenibacillus sp. MER 99-2]MCM3173212.1 hypothetical protein [Paenibacillus sp. MER 99-2]